MTRWTLPIFDTFDLLCFGFRAGQKRQGQVTLADELRDIRRRRRSQPGLRHRGA